MSPNWFFVGRARRWVAVCWLAGVVASPHVARAASTDLPAVFPPGALAYLEMAGAEQVVDRLRQSGYWTDLLASPQWRRATETPQWRQLEAGATLLERQLGMDVWTAGGKLLGHRVAVAIYPGPTPERPHLLFVVSTADDNALAELRERLAPLLALAEEKVRVSQALDGGERINLDDQGFLAWKGSWLAFSNQQPLLDEAVKLLNGEQGKNLFQDEPFQAMLQQASWSVPASTTEVRLVRLYANLSLINQAAGGRIVPEKLDNVLGSLLLGEGLQFATRSPYVSAVVDVKDDGFLVKATMAANRAALGDDYSAYFPPDGGAGVDPLPQAPQLLGGVTMYRDFAGWYDHREQLLQEQLMPEFDKFEGGLANLLPGKDFGQDVLPLLGRRLSFVSAPQDFSHLDGAPAVKLPGFALVVELAKPDEAAAILQLFTQTLAAILNIEAGQQGRQPWVMTSESYHGVQIAYAAYLDRPSGDQLGIAFNFLPATARVGDQYILSSSVGLCRQLVDALQHPAGERSASGHGTLGAELRIEPIAELLETNRQFLQGRMIQEGRTAEEAAAEFDALLGLLRSFSSVGLEMGADRDTYQVQLQGSWK